jgi:hypothetical protein
MEQLLHYVWKHKLFPLKPLVTTEGLAVEVLDPGLPNMHAGPDFFNAKLKLDGTLWVGNVEIHTVASDWMRHGHHLDAAYNNVILHVAETIDCEVCCASGSVVPQLQLSCPDSIRLHYEELRRTDCLPPCYHIIPSLPKLTVHSWLSALQAERFEEKSRLLEERRERCAGNWADTFFVTLARNFGFGLNGDAFEAWAYRLPFRALDKHRDNLFQLEAFFFGQAGLLAAEPPAGDDYYLRLQKEHRYLTHKFSLPEPLPAERWRLLRTRPGNFPHVRISQLAQLYHKEPALFSRIMEAEDAIGVCQLLQVSASPYWEEHHLFGHSSASRKNLIGGMALNLILINTVIPFLHAYGVHRADERLCLRAMQFLEELKAEDNTIIRQWEHAGIAVHSAADTQALLQLRKAYCDRKECLRCRFGFEYLRSKQ